MESEEDIPTKFVEYKRRFWLSVFVIGSLLIIVCVFNLVILIPFIDDRFTMLIINIIQAFGFSKLIDSKWLTIKMERPVIEVGKNKYGMTTLRLGESRPFQGD